MNFVKRSDIRRHFDGKRVAIVGSGPGVLDNDPGLIDGHNIVVRINNYALSLPTGKRTDVFYSFFGESIRKTAKELKRDGVKLCMCKCPNDKPIRSPWHQEDRRRRRGVDFTMIYDRRKEFWFCDTYIPETEDFMSKFRLLGGHIPTTGFSAILDALSFKPRAVYLTGFDFFRSKIHNVDRPWRQRHLDDPIGHVPETELQWLRENAPKYPITTDKVMAGLIAQEIKVAV